MRYSALLLNQDSKQIIDGHWPLITPRQWERLAKWSLETDRTIADLLSEFNPVIEQENHDSDRCSLRGILPHCGLYGCLASDGSTHT